MEATGINGILLIVTMISIVVAAIAIVFPWLKKKGVDLKPTFKVAEGVVNGADTITDILKAAFPTSAIAGIADKIIDYARIGVEKAEQLYYINEITGDQRKAEAIRFVHDALKLANIETTPAIEKIIDGAVEAGVYALGHAAQPPDPLEGIGVNAEP
jgi:hypothetical protein